MRRIARRLRVIGPHPVLLVQYAVHHAGARGRARWLRSSYARSVASPRKVARLRALPIGLGSASGLPPELAGPADRLRAEADEILRHEVDFLGSGPTALGDQIDWQRDFKSGYRWSGDFYLDVEVTRLTDTSDAKVPWELSRGHHLLTLARAARLFDDDRYAVELENQLTSWIAANQPGQGINWTNPMEVAIRAVNWVWAIATVEELRPLESGVRAAATRSLQVHGRHIAANLEGSPWLRSNHYLADVLGLLVLGAVVDGDPAARRWFATGRRAFEREIMRQVHPDGLAFEASLPYHGLVLEMFVLARHVASWSGNPLSAAYDRRLERMLVATSAVRHPSGRLPQFGDADSGRVLPSGWARPPTADHLPWLGVAVLGQEAPLPGGPHEEVAWTLGLDAWKGVASRPPASAPETYEFPAGGVYVLAGGELHVVVRCGDVGQNGNGGHAHNDALSFELSRGLPVVVDSGTYVYTSDPGARNAFRATAAHNTVVVAGQEINPIAKDRLFELAQFAQPQVERFEPYLDSEQLVARHDGYRRLDPPVEHRRTFSLDRSSGSLTVFDELLGSGAQVAESFVHLAPGTDVRRCGELVFQLVKGDATLDMAFTSVDAVELEEGWISDGYGRRQRAPVLRARVEGRLPLRFGYRFTTAP
jgi:hypothetical protein